MIGLCDCNNFFVSCQRIFRPDLDGKPVMVLSGNDGCVIARSNEVKTLGIKMGVPLFQVKDIVKKNKITLFSANHKLYADISCRVMETLRQLTSKIEVYSVDEAFIDFSGIDSAKLKSQGEEISKIIRRNTGVPVSIGIAPSKTLAKVASELCKKYPKLNGCCVMQRPKDIEKVLRKLPIEDVWGIGRKSSKKLQMLNIITAYDFTLLDKNVVQSQLSITGVRTWKELQSTPAIELQTTAAHQSISIGRSFAKNLKTLEELHSMIVIFATTIADKLRRQGSCTTQITTYIYTNHHHTDAPQRYESDTVKLEVPTDSTIELVNVVTESLKKIFLSGYEYKKAGVICSNFTRKNEVQNSLFDTINREKHNSLMRSIDHINERYGSKSVTPAATSGVEINTNRQYLSPNYTTAWEDVLKVVMSNQ